MILLIKNYKIIYFDSLYNSARYIDGVEVSEHPGDDYVHQSIEVFRYPEHGNPNPMDTGIKVYEESRLYNTMDTILPFNINGDYGIVSSAIKAFIRSNTINNILED